MRIARRLLPDGTLGRTRLGAVAVGSIALLTEAPQLGNTLRSVQFIRLSAVAIVIMLVILLYTYVRGRSRWWTVPVVPALVALGGAGLHDPVAGTALGMGTLVVLSLYGSMRMWLFRVVSTLIAVPAAVAISPQSADRTMAWNSPTVIGVLPQVLLMAVLTRGIYLAMRRTERSARRDAVLARGGHAMIGKTDVAQVRAIGGQIAAELAALAPGVALLVVRRGVDGLRITNLAGAPDELRGRAIGPELIAEPARLAELMPGYRGWQIACRGLAARFGGDEFAMLLTGLSGPDEAPEIADRLAARLAEPVRLTTTTVTTGASIGVATAEPGITPAELTRRADLAMYAAKAGGKQRVETFGPACERMPA